MRQHSLKLIVLLLFSLGAGRSANAQEYGIIDDVTVRPLAAGREIRITFNKSAQYVGHTPKRNGKALFIELRLTGPAPSDFLVPQQQQLRFSSEQNAPLTGINYNEEGGNRARLELDFAQAVSYSVRAHNDFRGVTVIVTPEATTAPRPEIKASPAIEKKALTLMNEARKAMLEQRDFRRALTLYQSVLDLPENSQSRTALELLGLAHERLGQREEAKSIYERYLQSYPEGEGSERVRQRLMSLVTATRPEQKRLRKEGPGSEGAQWDTYGSLSQFYLHNTYTVDNSTTQTTVKAVSTDLDLVVQRRSADSDSRMRVTAGYYHDLLPDGRGDSSRASALYVEHHDRKLGWWARAGRQSGSRDGVLGKFDGLKLGYALGKRVEATLVAGSPVYSSRDNYDDSRQFGGIALDFGPFANNWEFSLYGINQQNASLIDREAIGSELRYFRQNLIVLGLIDYDTFYEELNIGMLLANWTLENDLTINATVDVRKSPMLTTQNALQGQTVTTIDELRTLYDDDTIYQLARDRTAEVRTFTLGLSKPLSTTLRLAGDLTVMNTSATVASAGVAAMPATDDEYFLNLQAIGTGVINGDDISTLGLRFSDTTTANGVGLYGSSRLPLGDHWRVNPRLRIDYREWKDSTQTQWIAGPAVRVEYAWNKLHFEMELGGNWTRSELPDSTETSNETYGSLGYRYEF